MTALCHLRFILLYVVVVVGGGDVEKRQEKTEQADKESRFCPGQPSGTENVT